MYQRIINYVAEDYKLFINVAEDYKCGGWFINVVGN